MTYSLKMWMGVYGQKYTFLIRLVNFFTFKFKFSVWTTTPTENIFNMFVIFKLKTKENMHLFSRNIILLMWELID